MRQAPEPAGEAQGRGGRARERGHERARASPPDERRAAAPQEPRVPERAARRSSRRRRRRRRRKRRSAVARRTREAAGARGLRAAVHTAGGRVPAARGEARGRVPHREALRARGALLAAVHRSPSNYPIPYMFPGSPPAGSFFDRLHLLFPLCSLKRVASLTARSSHNLRYSLECMHTCSCTMYSIWINK